MLRFGQRQWIFLAHSVTTIAFCFPAWLATANHLFPTTQTTQPSLVSVSGRQLLVRRRLADATLGPSEPYVIRGMNWSPAGQTTVGNNDARRIEFWNWHAMDIPLLKGMNVNTVRLFLDPGVDAQQGPRGLQVLDELYRNGIMVVMTVDDANRNAARIASVVNYYKQHPSVLMWLVGNEWNVTHCAQCNNSCPKISDLANYIENAAAQIKLLDANHPVATSYGELNFPSCDATLFEDTRRYVNEICRSVDVWGLNLYRGNTFGNLFAQWASLSQKPMFLCEFGTDALFAISPTAGRLEGAVQAHWNFSLWREIAANLSARNPDNVVLGGCLFEWNDEWWKITPPGSQQFGGYDSANGHPDGKGNEEFFGVVDIHRQKRPVYDLFKVAFDPAYQPLNEVPLRMVSRGALASEYPTQNGVVRFFKAGAKLYEREGSRGGRGFTVVTLNAVNGELLREIRTFDTWNSPNGQTLRDLIAHLNSFPNGALVLLGIADEAGLTQFDSCTLLNLPWTIELLDTLTALGSTKIQNYCYRGSWAMAAVKGEGRARQEVISPDQEVAVELLFQVNHFPYEGDLTPATSGNGAVTVSDWVRAGRLIAGLETVASQGEFQRLDCSPSATLGDGMLTMGDWVQVGRYAAGLDVLLLSGGPSALVATVKSTQVDAQPSAPGARLGARRSRPSLIEAEIENEARSVVQAAPERTVTIFLSAQGSENAAGFSLGFDARHWRYSGFQAGTDSGAASLQVNTANADKGKLGVALALSAGKSFSPGQKELLVLHFTSLTASPSSLGLTWEDFPVARMITAYDAASLDASFHQRLRKR